MKLDTTLSVQPTSSTTPYTNINQVVRDYYAGKPVLVRGHCQLSGLTVDRYETPYLKDMGYTHVEFRLGDRYREVAL